ncbi:NUMOD4 domain-containing protein [Achromobacter ruhlandii]|uniref:NUMOD4 domain-containing protein n=1 Tax=Achromobacter ruhlandii TaxID=72557 RepID=UPI0009EEE2CD|nr:NUMOD4 domain-containing protein [Achromobacter ruhlandii]
MDANVELRDIPGYEGSYAASVDGRIWSFPKAWRGMRGMEFSHAGKWMKTPVDACGYPVVNLRGPTGYRRHQVHRLVAMAWLPNPSALPEVNHLNGIRADSSVCNLEWCSRSENIKHAYRTGLLQVNDAWRERARTMGLSTRRLTQEAAEAIRQLAAAGVTQTKIASQYGLSRAAIYKIVTRKSYPTKES